jgi:heme iron utilization protein
MTSSTDIQKEADQLRSGCETLLLSTVNGDAFPEISYAAYIEDESQANNPFGRKRLTYQCEANFIGRDGGSFDDFLDKFQGHFGNLIETLRNLADFQLFELVPDKGRYVAGFGKTFEIDCQDNQYEKVTESELKSKLKSNEH